MQLRRNSELSSSATSATTPSCLNSCATGRLEPIPKFRPAITMSPAALIGPVVTQVVEDVLCRLLERQLHRVPGIHVVGVDRVAEDPRASLEHHALTFLGSMMWPAIAAAATEQGEAM